MAAIRTRSLDGHPKCGVTSLPTLCLVNRVIAVADEVCGFFCGAKPPTFEGPPVVSLSCSGGQEHT